MRSELSWLNIMEACEDADAWVMYFLVEDEWEESTMLRDLRLGQ